MNRPWQIWLTLGLCLAVLLAAMTWTSLTVLRLDRAEARSRQLAHVEENVRLALWRMDSLLARLIGEENTRPYFAYTAFYPAERAYTRMFAEIQRGEILVPSPLLPYRSPYIQLHFQFGPDGRLSSPQAPGSNMRDLAEATYKTHEDILGALKLRGKLESLVKREAVLTALEHRSPRPVAPPPPVQMAQVDVQQTEQYQRLRSSAELAKRNIATANPQGEQQTLVVQQGTTERPAVSDGTMKPVWVGEELLLARRIAVSGEEYLQGCWLNWSEIRQWLLEEIQDLFPAASLERVEQPSGDSALRMLAALPVRLVPGGTPSQPATGLSPIRVSLIVAWVCVVVAGAAVGALLFGAVSLSERRGAFVSAVTHELRTPLTTFRMYSEMLAEGMLSDEEKQRQYLRTLCVEADRLSHLVENVLAYARLERGRARGTVESVPLGEVADRAKARLTERARQAGMELVLSGDDEATEIQVRADTSAVEQILFNLVDNACKYAQGAADRRIHLEAIRSDNAGEIRIRDHGEGIQTSEMRRLFLPFSKSAKDAANSAPGVGLGLSLSRRLARAMGGDLRGDDHPDGGACFVLSLPRA